MTSMRSAGVRLMLAAALGFGFYLIADSRFDSRMHEDVTILEKTLQETEISGRDAKAIGSMFRNTAAHTSSLCYETVMIAWVMIMLVGSRRQ